MNFTSIFTSLIIISGVVEALVETIKIPYLQLRGLFLAIFGVRSAALTAYEKRLLTLVIGVVLCLSAGFGIDLPAWSEPSWTQSIIAGILISLGSNVLHLLLSIAMAFKNSVEKVKSEPLPGWDVDPEKLKQIKY